MNKGPVQRQIMYCEHTEFTPNRQIYLQSNATVSSSSCVHGPSRPTLQTLTPKAACLIRIRIEAVKWEKTNLLSTWKNSLEKVGLPIKEMEYGLVHGYRN